MDVLNIKPDDTHSDENCACNPTVNDVDGIRHILHHDFDEDE